MRKAILVTLFVAVMAWPGKVSAQLFSVGDYDFNLTESLYFDWHRNESFSYVNDQFKAIPGKYDFYDLKNRLNFSARSRWLQAGLRLDVAGFIGPGSDPAKQAFQDSYGQGHSIASANTDVRLEKIYARMRFGPAGVEVGDIYGCLGKGIALCVKKVDELSTDTSLRGLKAYYNSRLFGGTLMAGLGNTINVGDTIEEFLPDPNDFVGGIEARVSPVWWMKLTAHGSLLVDRQAIREGMGSDIEVPGWIAAPDFDDKDIIRRDLLAVIGPTLSFPDIFGHGSFFVEYDAMLQTWAEGDPADHPDSLAGQVLYSTGTFDWKILHLMVELKWYDSHLDEALSETNLMGTEVERPSGESEFVYYGVLPPVDDESLLFRNDRPYDVVGGRVRADVEIPPVTGVVFASFTDFEDTDLGPALANDYFIRHIKVGWEQRLDDYSIIANASGGYRQELFHSVRENMWHAEGDVHFPIWGPLAMELAGRYEAYDRPVEEISYQLSQAAATLSLAPWLGLTFTHEFSDQVTADKSTSGHFYNVEVIYRFMSGSYVKVFGGSSRGGLKCAGGMCRTFPPFEGVKGELTLRF
jgi:hypothetical protein